jgi:integrase
MAKASKLPSGNWRVIATKTVDGVKLRKSFSDKNKKTAEKNAAEWAASVSSVNVNDDALSSYYDRYIKAKEKVLSPNTIRSYKAIKKTHFQELMSVKIDRLTEEQIQRAVNIMAAASSPKTVRNAYGLLTAVLSMFRPEFHPRISLPQKQKHEVYIPSDDVIKKVVELSEGQPIHIPILLAAFGGLREGEICALTKEDFKDNKVSINKSIVYSEGKRIVKSPKTYSGFRTVELPPFVIKAIADNNWIVYNGCLRNVAKQFQNLLQRNNLPKFRFHDLRHYYVSSLFDMGIPEKYIIAQVGHSSSTITKAVYDHIMTKKQSQYAALIASSFEKIL